MKKGYIFYSRKDLERNEEFAQRFINYGRDFGLDIGLLTEEQIAYGITGQKPFCSISPCDFAINRTRNAYLAYCLEALGIRVFNSGRVTALCNDKCLAYLHAACKEIPCLDTYIYKRKDLLERAAGAAFFPCVLKQPASHGGKKVFFCRDGGEVKSAAAQIEGEYVIAQRALAESGICDIRVYVLGNSIAGAVRRRAREGIKANYCQGGDISLYDVPEKLKRYVEKLTEDLYFDFAGFDFLTVDDRDFYFNEIEDAVGSRSLCILKDIDTSKLYLSHIKDILK